MAENKTVGFRFSQKKVEKERGQRAVLLYESLKKLVSYCFGNNCTYVQCEKAEHKQSVFVI